MEIDITVCGTDLVVLLDFNGSGFEITEIRAADSKIDLCSILGEKEIAMIEEEVINHLGEMKCH